MASSRWKKGQSGNPNGKPKSNARKLLEEAVAAEGKKRKKTIYQHMVEQAYEDHAVLIALVRKLLPDLRTVDASIFQREPFRLILTNGVKSAKPDDPERDG